MIKKLLIIMLVLWVVSACSLFNPRQSTPTPQQTNQVIEQQVTPTQQPTSTPPRGNTPGAEAETCPVVAMAMCNPSEAILVQPVELRGTFSYSNDIITTYYIEHAVALTDMYGFVTRDREWEIPIASQTLGYLKLDTANRTGEFLLQLPARPAGTLVDVNPDGNNETGVQVFTLAYSPNLTGGPYSEGDDSSRGWPSYLASTRHDTENADEVIGGKLIIWSPDDRQSFPSGYGSDELLFTEDDPVQPVPAGYSIIDLDQTPFAILRDPDASLTLYEPEDIAIKDYSNLSYSEAFDKVINFARKEYAFNGIEGKEPNWDDLYASLAPRIADAEKKGDASAFGLAMHDFTMAFTDGHVGISGDLISQLYNQNTAGGYGFAVRELDDGRVIAVFVDPEGAAARAGMKQGAVITSFNDMPTIEAIGTVFPWSGPFSTESGKRYEQARFLVRAPIGTTAKVSFTNPNESSRSANLIATDEQQSLFYTSPYRGMNPYGLPVEYEIFPNNVGYIRISSNYDDLNLIIRLFERALKIFNENGMNKLIIDLRQNSGGANLGLAGFLYDQDIEMGQLEYFSEKTGRFEPEGQRGKILPNQTQYSFDKKVLIVGLACASACELEAYGFSQVPGMVVVGQYPTSGTEAEVARGQFKLPEGISLQFPTGRFTLPDGSLFLEGTGVQPTRRIPVNEENVLSSNDTILFEAYLLAR